MDRCESTSRLLDCDELDLVSYAAESDGNSSGYDSATESSDVDSENEAVQPRGIRDDVGDAKRYRSTQSLCHDLKYIMSMPELCDVKFLVGDKKIPVYGIKAVLATRSKVFYSLVLKSQRQMELTALTKDKKKVAKQTTTHSHHMVIEAKKYKPEDFRRIVQFVHCGTIDISVDNVVGLYCGASQFGLSDLKIACWDFIQSTLKKIPSLTSVLEPKIQNIYNQHKSSQRLLNKITDYVSSIAEEKESRQVGKETAI